MKTTTKLLTILAVASFLGGAAAFADDPALQNRLALQKKQSERTQAATTIAFYSRGRGIGRTTERAAPTELRVREHFTPHGTAHYLLVPAK